MIHKIDAIAVWSNNTTKTSMSSLKKDNLYTKPLNFFQILQIEEKYLNVDFRRRKIFSQTEDISQVRIGDFVQEKFDSAKDPYSGVDLFVSFSFETTVNYEELSGSCSGMEFSIHENPRF